MAKELELWGELCPIPLLKAEKELKYLEKGEELVIITDHSCTARAFSNWVKKHNRNKISYSEIDNGIWRIIITKG